MTTQDLSAAWPGRDAESLLWLASFPRSGNTFARILLANYMASNDGIELNDVRHFIPADTSPHVWAATPSAPPGDADWETNWKARSTIFDNYRKIMGARALPGMKTHSANAVAFGVKGFGFRENDRALYVVRHPLDVLLSFADFNNIDFETAIRMMTYRGFSLHNGETGGMEIRGSWQEHVKSWIGAESCPLLLVRYEELRSSTAEVLRSILSFLHVPVIEERVERAVAASQFETLREKESTIDFVELPEGTASGRFFREGKSLQWLRQLSPEQAYLLADTCENTMKTLGYTHPRDVYFDGRNAIGPVSLQP